MHRRIRLRVPAPEERAGVKVAVKYLNDELREGGAMTVEEALLGLKSSLLGLDTARRHRIVHRDYKPDNVLVDRDGSSKLVDFGIAVHRRDAMLGHGRLHGPELWHCVAAPGTTRTRTVRPPIRARRTALPTCTAWAARHAAYTEPHHIPLWSSPPSSTPAEPTPAMGAAWKEAMSPTDLDDRWLTGPAVPPTGEPEGALIAFGPGVRAPERRRGLARWRLPRPAWRALVAAPMLSVTGDAEWRQFNRKFPVGSVLVQATPPPAACNNTAVISADVGTNGQAGTLSYRWWKSNGQTSEPRSKHVPQGQRHTRLQLDWAFRGPAVRRGRARRWGPPPSACSRLGRAVKDWRVWTKSPESPDNRR